MNNKTIIGCVIASILIAPTADAGWFCGSQTAKFAEWRTADTLQDVTIGPQSVVWSTAGLVITCGPDNTCRGTHGSPPDPTETRKLLFENVAKYKAKVLAMHEWADALSDSCLRDGYNAALKEHDRRVKEDEEALEFMNSTPEPLAPTS
jgi:hypothetical protein